jgi:hypothetical protein
MPAAVAVMGVAAAATKVAVASSAVRGRRIMRMLL